MENPRNVPLQFISLVTFWSQSYLMNERGFPLSYQLNIRASFISSYL